MRYGRFAALSAVGLLITGAGAVITAQTRLNLSAGELVAAAEVRGLNARETSNQAGDGMLDASDRAVTIVTMHDVTMTDACMRMNSINVPFLGKVTVTAVLPEGATFHADALTIDSASFTGPMQLDDMLIGSGAAQSSERSGGAGVSLSSGSLTAPHLDVELAGLHANRITSSTIDLKAERGDARC